MSSQIRTGKYTGLFIINTALSIIIITQDRTDSPSQFAFIQRLHGKSLDPDLLGFLFINRVAVPGTKKRR